MEMLSLGSSLDWKPRSIGLMPCVAGMLDRLGSIGSQLFGLHCHQNVSLSLLELV